MKKTCHLTKNSDKKIPTDFFYFYFLAFNMFKQGLQLIPVVQV